MRILRHKYVIVCCCAIVMVSASGVCPAAAAGQQVGAKTIQVFQFSLPAGCDVKQSSLEFSRDGAKYYPFESRIPGEPALFYTVSQTPEMTTLSVPLVGYFGTSSEVFLFEEAGAYWLRWRIGDVLDEGSILVEHSGRIIATSPADETMLSRLADPALVRRLIGPDFFERQTDAMRHRLLAPDGLDMRALLTRISHRAHR